MSGLNPHSSGWVLHLLPAPSFTQQEPVFRTELGPRPLHFFGYCHQWGLQEKSDGSEVVRSSLLSLVEFQVTTGGCVRRSCTWHVGWGSAAQNPCSPHPQVGFTVCRSAAHDASTQGGRAPAETPSRRWDRSWARWDPAPFPGDHTLESSPAHRLMGRSRCSPAGAQSLHCCIKG